MSSSTGLGVETIAPAFERESAAAAGGLVIHPAGTSDFPWIRDHLAAASLPTEGIDPAAATFLVAEVDGRRVGAIGLERHGPFALLRSAIVEAGARGRGAGGDLTRALLDLALEQGVRSVFLLTSTAADFFVRFGFESVSRSDAPAPIRESAEFMSLCPASATLMRKDLP